MAMRITPAVSALASLFMLAAYHPSSEAQTHEEIRSLATFPELDGRSVKAAPWKTELLEPESGAVVLADLDGNVIPLTGKKNDGRFVYLPNLLPGDYVLSSGGAKAAFTVEAGGGEDAPPITPMGEISYKKGLVTPALTMGILGIVLILAGAARGRNRAAMAAGLSALSIAAVLHAFNFGSGEPMTLEECMRRFSDDLAAQNVCILERSTYTLVVDGVRPAVLEMRDARPQGCHDLGHELGRRAWLVAGPDETLQRGLELCYNSYYHGVLYGAATYMEDEEYLELLQSICPRLYAEGSGDMGSCAHGVGHAALMRLGGNLPAAESICYRMIPSGYEYSLECRGAAIGEHVKYLYAAISMNIPLPDPGEDPLDVCLTMGLEVVTWCYSGTVMGLKKPHGSGGEFLEICLDRLEPGERRLACIQGMAVEFRNVHSHEPEGSSICLILKDQRERDTCGYWASYGLYMGQNDSELAARSCVAARVSEGVCDSMKSWSTE